MDTVELLNRIFPSNEKLGSNLSEAREFNNKCIDHLQAALDQRKSGAELRSSAPDLQGELGILETETRKIQQQGTETLDNVHAVTREIKRLDTTKENLSSSIRMLRQLKMLTKLYLQLDILLKEQRYEDMSGVVRAASDLTDYFRPFRPLPQISKLSQEIGEMESKIYVQIERDFANVTGLAENGPTGGIGGSTEICISACHVLDTLDSALGQPINRNKLISWYSDAMLREYKAIFNTRDEAGSLENVNRRYTYLKNKVILRYVASHAQLFPAEWPVKDRLITECGDITSNDLVAQLPTIKANDSDQIQTLLSTIYESTAFENYVKTPGLITPKLMPYLSLWVDFQNHQIAQRVIGYSRALVPPQETDEVIPSSRELVNFYRALLAQLSQIKNHEKRTVCQFAEVLATHLGKYAQRVLLGYLPEQSLQNNSELLTLRIVNATADYILVTTSQLERSLQSQLSDDEELSQFVDEVFENRASTLYRSVGIKCENLIVQYIQRTLEPMWIEMAHHYTQASRNGGLGVSSVSPYTTQIISTLSNLLHLSVFESSSVRAPSAAVIYTVFSRTAEIVSSGFLTMAMARVSKPLTEPVVEQMLLDLGSLKSHGLMQLLSEIPQDVRETKGGGRLERLNSKILETVGQAEAVLKVLHTPAEPMETFIRNYQVLVKDRSTLNFRKILDVKGVRFQPRAMEKFRLMASQEISLVPENTLLRGIPTVPPASQYDNQLGTGSQGFGLKRIGDFLRREG